MDTHLNLFVAYGHEFIENNLTRAFVITLDRVSKKTLRSILTQIHPIFMEYDMSSAKVALQNNIDSDPHIFKKKHIVTLSTDTFYLYEKEVRNIRDELVTATLHNEVPPADTPSADILSELCNLSVPDAWIYDAFEYQYCFLIESKKEQDFVYYPQIIRHAYRNFGIDNLEEIDACTIRLTWYDVLEACALLAAEDKISNEQERFIIDDFIRYLGLFGYYRYRGFSLLDIPVTPEFAVEFSRMPNVADELFHFYLIPPCPSFQMQDYSAKCKTFFNFMHLEDMRNIRIIGNRRSNEERNDKKIR